ncbi:citrulline utilization hydrolase CtlX [Marinigracilibium pacificum]|uniref:Amidinotransferase n=1 Tax=Marinigracilibium pacificum TaxID=2729599 RepID=A0A848J581_9BACT|nr:arginine deiminase-related protein [Marinigracilibium pacificum]NMM50635.1 amidinotransferase [Marinigracilibium pacificum]
MSQSIQAAPAVMMVRPVKFGANPETAQSNAFQQSDEQGTSEETQQKALEEFDSFVDLLRAHDIEVMVVQDTEEPHTPDSIFPNNWISMHSGGLVIKYPMEAVNRRNERREDIEKLLTSAGYNVKEIIDVSGSENDGEFLEGTGSIIFDYDNNLAYANLSSRTHEGLLNDVCGRIGFEPVIFHAYDQKYGKDVYHTNVVMCLANEFVVICLDAIPEEEHGLLLDKFEQTDKKVIAISYEQMNNFAGNMLEVKSKSGESYTVMSKTAYDSLVPGQISAIESFSNILTPVIPTIEKYGGGSVRCMLAGIWLEKNQD